MIQFLPFFFYQPSKSVTYNVQSILHCFLFFLKLFYHDLFIESNDLILPDSEFIKNPFYAHTFSWKRKKHNTKFDFPSLKERKKLPREVKWKAAKTEEIYTESLRYCRHCVTLQHTMFEHYIHVEAIWWWWWWWWCNKKKSGNSNRWKYY